MFHRHRRHPVLPSRVRRPVAPGCPTTKFWARIRLTQVRMHHGHRYFAIMKLTRGNGRVMWLAMDTSYGVWRWRG